MKSLITRFIKDESGATAIEYGLIAGLMAVLVIAGLQTNLGTAFKQTFTDIATSMDATP
ncbi:Flp family type IVb pilin [Microvirga sp. GCM10011540]|uniref:Flp family type IVb pilin n=1 Tax=Microvirga sp. GCM10011540 TaxID=3317338 RepID=UPI003607E0D1